MDILQIITVAPNLAFGVLAIWFLNQIQKERVAENARYATSLEKVNALYIALLEKAVTAIANNAALSAANGENIAKLTAEIVAIRADIGKILDAINRIVRDSPKRNS